MISIIMSLEKIEILNILINKDNLSTLLEQAIKLIEKKEKFYVCAPNAFLTVKANEDKQLLKIINEAAIVVPDGMSSVWVAKRVLRLSLFIRRFSISIFSKDIIIEIIFILNIINN